MTEQGRLFPLLTSKIEDLNPCQEGTWREHQVISDLIQRGFVLFIRQGNGGSPDLLMLGPKGNAARVEVKATGTQRGVCWEDCDLLAVVNERGDISYFRYNWDLGQKRRCDPVDWFRENIYDPDCEVGLIVDGYVVIRRSEVVRQAFSNARLVHRNTITNNHGKFTLEAWTIQR